MKFRRLPLILAGCLISALALRALGHPGHATGGFVAGLAHPLWGIDHVLTMVAVGIWASQLGGRATWLVPLSFLAFMVAGAGAAFAGLQVASSAVDQAVAASLLIMGLFVASALHMPTLRGVALAALFAALHGYAHGTELHAGISAAAYGAGFIGTTTCLLAAGVMTAALFEKLRQPSVIRIAGASFAIAALLLLGGVL